MVLNKKNKLLLIIFSTLIITGMVIAIFLITTKQKNETNDNKNLLIEAPGIPEEERDRKIDIKIAQNKKLVKNRFDKYEISVPNNWNVGSKAKAIGGLTILYGNESTEKLLDENSDDFYWAESFDGLALTILVFQNEQNYLIDDWLQSSNEAKNLLPKFELFKVFNNSQGLAYKASHILLEYVDGSDVGVPRFDSLVQEFVFQKKQKIYVVTCSATGENFENLSKQCADQIPSFTILD